MLPIHEAVRALPKNADLHGLVLTKADGILADCVMLRCDLCMTFIAAIILPPMSSIDAPWTMKTKSTQFVATAASIKIVDATKCLHREGRVIICVASSAG